MHACKVYTLEQELRELCHRSLWIGMQSSLTIIEYKLLYLKPMMEFFLVPLITTVSKNIHSFTLPAKWLCSEEVIVAELTKAGRTE